MKMFLKVCACCFICKKSEISYFVCVRVVRYLPYLHCHPKKNQVCLVVVIGFPCRVRVVRGLGAEVVKRIVMIGRNQKCGEDPHREDS